MNSISAGLAISVRTSATTRHLVFRAWLWTCLLAFARIAFGPQPAQAAVTEAWVQRYGEVGSEDSAYKVVTDAGGNVIVAGSTGNQTGSGDMLIIKYSGAGVPQWTNHYGNTRHHMGVVLGAVAVDGSGNVFVTSSPGSGSDMLIIKYSGAGAPLWTNRYNGTENGLNRATALAVDTGGNSFVAGSSTGSGGDWDYATIAYSAAGVPLWTNRYDGPANDQDTARAVAVDESGNVVVTGSSVGSRNGSDYATIKYSGAGVPQWTNQYNGGPGNSLDVANAMAVDRSGKVLVTGSSMGGGIWDYATIAYSGAGVPLWTNRYDGFGNDEDIARAVAVDVSGNVVVTGSSVGNGGNLDFVTIKYSGAGLSLWTNRYNGSASAVVVDGSGNVFVTGNSFGSGSGWDYATIAYSGEGVPLWTNRYNGPANAIDHANAVAVDASGNVFVTGSSVGSGGDSDFVTVKYVHSTSAQLIINGSFETPDTRTYMYIYAGQNTLAPWVVGPNPVEIGDAVGNGFITGAAFEGTQMLDLHGRLTQAFATTPGSLYTITFAYTDNSAEPAAPGPALARVRLFDGLEDRLNQTFTHTGAASNDFHWTVFNGQFTALQSTTRLEFSPLTSVRSGLPGGMLLDAVQVFEGPSLKMLSITRVGSGAVALNVRGVPKGVHRIQASPDLEAGSFVDIATVTADAYGLFEFQDTRTGLTRSFYRVVSP